MSEVRTRIVLNCVARHPRRISPAVFPDSRQGPEAAHPARAILALFTSVAEMEAKGAAAKRGDGKKGRRQRMRWGIPAPRLADERALVSGGAYCDNLPGAPRRLRLGRAARCTK